MTQDKPIRPIILVCGKTGVGKTSLIQAITHSGTVPDERISDGMEGSTFIYETPLVKFIDCNCEQVGC